LVSGEWVTSVRVVFDEDEPEWVIEGVGIGTCGVDVRLSVS
jgi:hypothetical protein